MAFELPVVTETRDFLNAYAAARERAVDAKQQHAAGVTAAILTEKEAAARLRQAGIC